MVYRGDEYCFVDVQCVFPLFCAIDWVVLIRQRFSSHFNRTNRITRPLHLEVRPLSFSPSHPQFSIISSRKLTVVPISADHYDVDANLVPTTQAVVVIQLGSQYIYSPPFTITTSPSSAAVSASTASATTHPTSDAPRTTQTPFGGAMIFTFLTTVLCLVFM